MSEPPFRPREKILEKQKYFQSVHKHTYLKGPYDKDYICCDTTRFGSICIVSNWKRDLQYVTWNRKERMTCNF